MKEVRNSSTSLCVRLGKEAQDTIHVSKTFWALFKEQNLTKTPRVPALGDQGFGEWDSSCLHPQDAGVLCPGRSSIHTSHQVTNSDQQQIPTPFDCKPSLSIHV